MFTYVSLISHLAIFPSNLASSSFLELCTLLLQPSSFLPCLLKPRSAQRPQPPLHPKPETQQSVLSLKNAQSSQAANTALQKCAEQSSCTALRNCAEVSSQDPHPAAVSLCLKTVQCCPSCLVCLACRNCADGPPRASFRQQSLSAEIAQIYLSVTTGKGDMLKSLPRS
jgi:hypothetical protein